MAQIVLEMDLGNQAGEYLGFGAFTRAGAWTDVLRDVRGDLPITVQYGIRGTGPLDRVASTGTMKFGLDNSQTNGAGLLGYYAPDHVNARPGFENGIACRLRVTHGGVTYTKFAGVLDADDPQAGQFEERLTFCSAMDWMDEAARHKLRLIPIQLNKRGDELITTVLGNMTRQPVSTSLATGQSTFPYALDDAMDERTTTLAVLQKIARSELGYVYIKGDTAGGGVLCFEDRHARPKITVPASMLEDSMVQLVASRRRARIINRFKMAVHPRDVDAAATTVLYSLRSVPKLTAGQSLTQSGGYTDPNQRGVTRVGGTDMVTPEAGTDYLFNSAPDGTGTDLTAYLSVTVTFGGNSAEYTLVNTGTVDGHVTKFQLRGRGYYDYEPSYYDALDETSRTRFGEGVLTFDMPYQSSPQVGTDAGGYLVSKWKDPHTFVDRVEFIGNLSDELMTAGLAREPGDRVRLVEMATGISSDWFINGVNMTISPPDIIRFGWVVTPADLQTYWAIGTAGLSELGVVTFVGF